MTRTFAEYQADKREREWKDRVQAQKEAMGNAERVQRATEWKRIGNDKFKAGNCLEALDYYREAIVFVEDLVDARRQERVELVMPLYCNLAQVHLKLGEHEKAEEVAGKAILVAEVPRNGVAPGMHAKALFRRGLARRALAKLDEAKQDLAAALKLQPESEDVSQALAAVRAQLAEEAKRARQAMGGFFNKAASDEQKRDERRRADAEKLRLAEERRKERLALAEQRQQMQTAFEKLSKGAMLYEKREQEMEPVRKKEEEKRKTLELEQNLMNIIDESKGLPKTEKFDDFIAKKQSRCLDQNVELDQKKKILDKQKKEQQWEEDDVWRGQRDDHRRRLQAEREAGVAPPQGVARSFWEAKEVARWCEQRLRDLVMAVEVSSAELEPAVAMEALRDGGTAEGHVLKAIITDVLKVNGDASVVRLNPHKPPLYYYDYFLKLEWEVAVTRKDASVYRTAEELISAAAQSSEMKAPESVAEHRILAGTFKIKELCSEEEPADGAWPLATKVKRRLECGAVLTELSEGLRDELRGKVQRLLVQWAEEYRDHWS